jgi:elongation factor Ts
MEITAGLVKELRERTGAGMMDCKKALQEAGGDIEAAIEAMRKSGVAKAAKKAGRIAAEGVIAHKGDAKGGVLVEINSETDFVAKDSNFLSFAEAVAATVFAGKPGDVTGLLAMKLHGGSGTVEEARQQLVGKLGENIGVRRFVRVEAGDARLGAYVHGGRIGVLVRMTGGDDALARDIAMHVAASRPAYINEADVPVEVVRQEREVFLAQAEAQAAETGKRKPPEIVEKMVQGQVAKFVKGISLLGQDFIKDDKTSVGKLLGGRNAAVTRFERMEVGEGIEKQATDFAAEVMAQAQGG